MVAKLEWTELVVGTEFHGYVNVKHATMASLVKAHSLKQVRNSQSIYNVTDMVITSNSDLAKPLRELQNSLNSLLASVTLNLDTLAHSLHWHWGVKVETSKVGLTLLAQTGRDVLQADRARVGAENRVVRRHRVELSVEHLFDFEFLGSGFLDDFGFFHTGFHVSGEHHATHDSFVEVFDRLRPVGILLSKDRADVFGDFFFGNLETRLIWVDQSNVHATVRGALGDSGAHLSGADDGNIMNSIAYLAAGACGSEADVLRDSH